MSYLRIGGVPRDIPSALFVTCIRPANANRTFYRFDPTRSRICRTKPGVGLEIALFLSSLLSNKYPEVRFIPGDGWSPTPSGNSLVERANRGEYDFSFSEMAYTAGRAELISYSQPALFASGPCFLVCGPQGTFVHYKQFGVPHKLLSHWSIVFAYFVISFGLVLTRLFEQRLYVEQITPTTIFSEAVNVFLCKPAEKSFSGLLQNRFVFPLMFLVYLKGNFKAGLIENFTPEREYSFRTIEEIAKAIEEDGWVMGIQSRSYAVYDLLFSAEQLKPIADVLRRYPLKTIVMVEKHLEVHEFFAAYPKAIYFGKPNNIFSLFHAQEFSNCICEALDYRMTVLELGTFLNKDNSEMNEFVNTKLIEFREFGFLRHLHRKYGLLTGNIIDTEMMKNHGLVMHAHPRNASMQAFIGAFIIFGATQALAVAILFLEFLQRNSYFSSHK